jgi:hypothetical protein
MGFTMDEFADLEAELNSLQRGTNPESLKSLIVDIEYEGVEPTMFLKEVREHWTPAKRFAFVFLGILLTPLLGFGLLLIYLAFVHGNFFEECDVASCTVYLAEEGVVASYRMLDTDFDELEYLPISGNSYIRYSQRDVGDNNGGWVGNFHVITDGQEFELIPSVNNQKSLQQGRKVVAQFAKMAKINYR